MPIGIETSPQRLKHERAACLRNVERGCRALRALLGDCGLVSFAIASMLLSPFSSAYGDQADDMARCSLVYGAVFEAARKLNYWPSVGAIQERLVHVRPFLAKHRADPAFAATFRDVAARSRDLVERVQSQTHLAITKEEVSAGVFVRTVVSSCDNALGLQVSPFLSPALSTEEVKVELAHPGWISIVQSASFKAWLVKQPPSIQELEKSEQSKDVILLLDIYKRDGKAQ